MHTISCLANIPMAAVRVQSHLVLAVMLVLSCAPNHYPLLSQTDTGPTSLERGVYQAVNAQRRSRNLLALHRNQQLDTVARNHSLRMAQGRTKFGHSGAKKRAGLLICSLNLQSVAENVARSQGFDDPVAVAMKGWIASRGHRKNLFGAYDLTGIGVAESNDGTIFLTQIFGRSKP